MGKSKFKFNILDVVIVMAVVCSISAVIFNDTIKEAVGKPEIADVNVCVTFTSSLPAETMLVPEGTYVVFETLSEDKIKLNSKVERTFAVDKDGKKESRNFIVSFKGYKKLGRYYTENGKLIEIGSDCSVMIDGKKASGTVKSVNLDK